MKINKNFWKGKKVFLTGHTGFKGSWFVILLNMLGAKVYGYSLRPEKKSLFQLAGIKKLTENSIFGDIRNFSKLKKSIKKSNPDFIVHMAGQSLLKTGYLKTKYTYEVNAIGTLNILEVLNQLNSVKKALIITTDKVYENNGKKIFYKESDRLGGDDPYSNSKACAELIVKSYNQSFFKKKNIQVATARAGNVIGGGDWSKNRLIPDCMKMWLSNKIPVIRNPNSTRPWQHVLEALSGYLDLSLKLYQDKSINGESFNFSSDKIKNVTVSQFLTKIKHKWPEINWIIKKNNQFYESSLLQLDTFKAKKILKWKARLSIEETIKFVVDWYQNFKKNKKNTLQVSTDQILKFMKKK